MNQTPFAVKHSKLYRYWVWLFNKTSLHGYATNYIIAIVSRFKKSEVLRWIPERTFLWTQTSFFLLYYLYLKRAQLALLAHVVQHHVYILVSELFVWKHAIVPRHNAIIPSDVGLTNKVYILHFYSCNFDYQLICKPEYK